MHGSRKFDDVTISFFTVLKRRQALRGHGEGVVRCTIKACQGKNGQSAHSGKDDKDHEEHAVHHHGDILPVLLQLEGDGREDETAARKSENSKRRSFIEINLRLHSPSQPAGPWRCM